MSINTAHDISKIKIKRNKDLLTLLEIENKIVKLEMVAKYRLIAHNMKYIEEINKIIDIERKQLYEYDIGRNNEIKSITNTINNMDVNIDDITRDIKALKPIFIKTIDNIQMLTRCIPDIILINNIKTIPIMQEHQKRCIP